MNNIELYVVPDVHGRDFWKDLKRISIDKPVVFLGDYLDPYPDEKISKKTTIANFEEIIDLARSNSNVTLLSGNHDLTYAVSTLICDCRKDLVNYKDIRKLFIDNMDLFKLVWQGNVNGKNCLLSHAGIHPRWLSRWDYSTEDICKFNQLYLNRDSHLIEALAEVSSYRGGFGNDVGSPVWADIREYQWASKEDMEKIADFQICGHTQLIRMATLENGISCIDTRQIYAVYNDGDIRPIEGQNLTVEGLSL